MISSGIQCMSTGIQLQIQQYASQWCSVSCGAFIIEANNHRNSRASWSETFWQTAELAACALSVPQIRKLWVLLKKLSPEDGRLFLRFVTSCDRAPRAGFQDLRPRFTIRKVSPEMCVATLYWPSHHRIFGGRRVCMTLRRCEMNDWNKVLLEKGEDRLPTAATCFNVLKLPNYSTQKELEKKLLYAIRSGSGFNLS